MTDIYLYFIKASNTVAFHPSIRLIAAARSGGLCSNPACMKYLLGPGINPESHADVFEAAHIISKSETGPRYEFIAGFRYDDIDNCIALCRACHRLVDQTQNSRYYPKEMLRSWKINAEYLADARLNTPLNTPYFDPHKERETRNKFLGHFTNIVDDYKWKQSQLFDGIILRSLHDGITHIVVGIHLGHWNAHHHLRSHNSVLAFQQDNLIARTKETYDCLKAVDWAPQSWINNMSYLSCFNYHTSYLNMSNEGREYLKELDNSLNTLVAQVFTIKNLPI